MKIKVATEREISEGDTIALEDGDGMPAVLAGEIERCGKQVRVVRIFGQKCPIIAVMPESGGVVNRNAAIKLFAGSIPAGWGLHAYLIDISQCNARFVRDNPTAALWGWDER